MVFNIDRIKYKDCKYPEHEIYITKYLENSGNVYQFNAEDFRTGVLVGRLHCSICELMDGKLEPKAHNCGIGDVLAKLCFIDQDINGPNGNLQPPLYNECRAVRLLRRYPDKLRWIKKRSSSLMLAGAGGAGGQLYDMLGIGDLLSLALASGYNKVFLIFNNPGAIKSLSRPTLYHGLGDIL